METITINLPCKAYFHMGVFTSELASSLTTKTVKVIVTSFDKESGYCDLTDMDGNYWPCANINSLSFINSESIVDLKKLLDNCWEAALDHHSDDSDFPMGDCKKQYPSKEEWIEKNTKL